MSGFPLYDNLYKNATNKDLTAKQKKNFVKYVDTMNINAKELMYALIKTYYIEHNENGTDMPYSGTILNNSNNQQDLEWDLQSFPKNLKQILNNFLLMNIGLDKK